MVVLLDRFLLRLKEMSRAPTELPLKMTVAKAYPLFSTKESLGVP